MADRYEAWKERKDARNDSSGHGSRRDGRNDSSGRGSRYNRQF